MTILASVLELVGFVFISLASVMLVLIILEYFKGLKMPAFWLSLILSFYLSVTATFLDAAFGSAELTQATRLAANIFIFLGIYGAYKRMKTRV